MHIQSELTLQKFQPSNAAYQYIQQKKKVLGILLDEISLYFIELAFKKDLKD